MATKQRRRTERSRPTELILAIEPDTGQAGAIRRLVREHLQAELLLVDSRDAAVAELERRVPDLILVTALLSPRDEEELLAHLRTIDATHLQLLTIPQLARPQRAEKRGLLGGLKRGRKSAPQGCDPAIFADEIRAYLESVRDAKEQAEYERRRLEAHTAAEPAPDSGETLRAEAPPADPPPAVVFEDSDPVLSEPAVTALETPDTPEALEERHAFDAGAAPADADLQAAADPVPGEAPVTMIAEPIEPFEEVRAVDTGMDDPLEAPVRFTAAGAAEAAIETAQEPSAALEEIRAATDMPPEVTPLEADAPAALSFDPSALLEWTAALAGAGAEAGSADEAAPDGVVVPAYTLKALAAALVDAEAGGQTADEGPHDLEDLRIEAGRIEQLIAAATAQDRPAEAERQSDAEISLSAAEVERIARLVASVGATLQEAPDPPPPAPARAGVGMNFQVATVLPNGNSSRPQPGSLASELDAALQGDRIYPDKFRPIERPMPPPGVVLAPPPPEADEPDIAIDLDALVEADTIVDEPFEPATPAAPARLGPEPPARKAEGRPGAEAETMESRRREAFPGPAGPRLTPLVAWAHQPEVVPAEAPAPLPNVLDELFRSLRLPRAISNVSYGTGCRIGRVRITRRARPRRRKHTKAPLIIVSRQALEATREELAPPTLAPPSRRRSRAGRA